MSRIPQAAMVAFQDELEKMAIPGAQMVKGLLANRGAAIGAGAGVGTLVGGLGGAGLGAARDYRRAREQGASRGQAGLGSIGGAVMGGMKGMTAGLVAGGAAGGLASGTNLGSKLTGLASEEGRLSGMARYGQRQLHGLTGWVPEGFEKTPAGRAAAIRSLRDPDTVRAMSHVEQMGQKVKDLQDVSSAKEYAGAVRGHGKAIGRMQAIHRMQEQDLTNLPGLARGLVRKPGETAKTMWQAASPLDKGLAVGLPGLSIAGAAMSKPQEGEPGRAERIGGGLGGLSALGQSSMPMAAFSALGTGLGTVGKYTGRGIDRLVKGRRRMVVPPTSPTSPGMEPQPADVSSGPVEYQYSNAALGRPPEGLGGV